MTKGPINCFALELNEFKTKQFRNILGPKNVIQNPSLYAINDPYKNKLN